MSSQDWKCPQPKMLYAVVIICLVGSSVGIAEKDSTSCKLTQDLAKNYSINLSQPTHVQNGYYRLPKYVVPKNYILNLYPDLPTKKFNGDVIITIEVLEATKMITLHSKGLEIHTASLRNSLNQNVHVFVNLSAEGDKREFLNVSSNNEMPTGVYRLRIQFTGRLDKTIIGFYASTLKNGGTMVASKFEPTYARQAFPCFDEPDFKATFDISLVKPSTHVALSNMNEISKTKEDNNLEKVTFATSVPMSTYLACFVVCDFAFKETEVASNGIGNNFQLRTYGQKDQMHKIDFALDIGKRATEFYIKYYEVPFPLPKLDMIAIPDYQSGATEHWGLITYRETSFLVDESTASSQNKISVANTIAHELAHMWFGNLVTMKWWDDLWLNEGFASYMQVKALNAIEPSWTMLDQFLTKTLQSVLVTDAKLSSHPIVQTVETPDQITAIFDSISYNKGASVLRMLEGFIGEENFRKGVSDYLKKHKFGNTITQDLLSSLEPHFKKDNPSLNLTYIMDTWTRQMGYPVVKVTKGDAPNTFKLVQSRFLLDPEAVSPNDSPFNYRWFMPITYKTNNDENKNVLWFSDADSDVKLTLKSTDQWLKINNNQVGYYRVNYEEDMWRNLVQELKRKSDKLTISDRTHLLDDAFALAEAQAIPYNIALDMTTYLTVEEDYVPWQTASSIFTSLSKKLLGTVAYDHLKSYVQHIVATSYGRQTWERKKLGVIEGLLRTRILSLATWCSLPSAETKARSLLLTWLNNHGTSAAVGVEPDLRDIVYYYGMKSATQSEWDKLWEIFLREEDAQEQAKLRSALAAPRDPLILQKYLTLAWDEKNIRSQDYLNVVQFISMNPSGTALIWDDVRTRWPELVERFTLNSRYLGNLIPAITSTFNTELKLKEMEDLFTKYPEAGAGEAARRRALETVKNNIKWANTQLPAVTAWLEANKSA